MSPLRFLDDEAVEALTLGDNVAPELAALAAFTDRVRAVGDEPAPLPSLELQAMFASQAATKGGRAVREARAPRPLGVPPPVAMRSAQDRFADLAGRVAGLGIAARLALGVSVATAGLAGAGAAGALPDGADRALRSAIEAVTPLDLGRPGEADPRPGPGTTATTAGTTTSGAPGSPGAPGATGDGDGDGATDHRDGDGHQGDVGDRDESEGGGDRHDDDRGDGADDRGDPTRGAGRQAGDEPAPDDRRDDEGDGDRDDGRTRDRATATSTAADAATDTTTTNETTPASAPGHDPDAAGDEGTGPWQAWDADAAGSTG